MFEARGYNPPAVTDAPMLERIEQAEAFFRSMGALVRHGGNQAYYSPASDHIQMPPFQAFVENVPYYSTLAHEHTHWTATAGRCNRELGKRFGDNAYAAEELIPSWGPRSPVLTWDSARNHGPIMPSTFSRGCEYSRPIHAQSSPRHPRRNRLVIG
jgi:antirestriction protein ArdC